MNAMTNKSQTDQWFILEAFLPFAAHKFESDRPDALLAIRL